MNVGKYVGRTGFPGSSLNPTFALNPFPNSQQNYKLLWLIVWLYWQYYNDNEISKGYLYYTVPSKMKGKWKVFRDEADLQPAKYSHPKFLQMVILPYELVTSADIFRYRRNFWIFWTDWILSSCWHQYGKHMLYQWIFSGRRDFQILGLSPC